MWCFYTECQQNRECCSIHLIRTRVMQSIWAHKNARPTVIIKTNQLTQHPQTYFPPFSTPISVSQYSLGLPNAHLQHHLFPPQCPLDIGVYECWLNIFVNPPLPHPAHPPFVWCIRFRAVVQHHHAKEMTNRITHDLTHAQGSVFTRGDGNNVASWTPLNFRLSDSLCNSKIAAHTSRWVEREVKVQISCSFMV